MAIAKAASRSVAFKVARMREAIIYYGGSRYINLYKHMHVSTYATVSVCSIHLSFTKHIINIYTVAGPILFINLDVA